MRQFIIAIFLLTGIGSYSQSNYQKFKKLSSPKKWWIVFHPFKAKKALEISNETNRIADSIRKTDLLDKDHAGGQVDAFRHAYWMGRLKQEIGASGARSLGKSHEKENYLMYKKRKLEEGVVPDKISSEMDLYNNEVGLSLVENRVKTSKKSLILKIIEAIKSGKMKVIKKDKKGRFLTCDGKLILKEDLKGKWENEKCLVASNYSRGFKS